MKQIQEKNHFLNIGERTISNALGLIEGMEYFKTFFIADDGSWHHVMSPNDKLIASTIIQWLGSNCGMAFMEEALKDCGYKIVPIKD